MKLSKEVRDWQRGVEKRFDVTPDQSTLLDEAARLKQRIFDCEAQIDEDGLMLPLRGGGVKLHPASRTIENCQALLLRYLKELALHVKTPTSGSDTPDKLGALLD